MNDDVNVVFAVLLFVAFLAMLRARGLSHRQRELKETIAQLQSAPAAGPVVPGQTQEQYERIEQRLRVLERIVTDKSYNLAGQIEALRERTNPGTSDTREIERSI